MPDFSQIWTEKYRPQALGEIVGQTEIIGRLKAFVAGGSIPHMLFAGPAGVGKTTAAVCMARELFGEGWRDNFMETNASDERGIDVVRNKIKEFARTRPIGGTFKIIFLDECDALTRDAQNALRRTMENYSSTCRFILNCNYSSKIIEPIQSRCAVFRFSALSEKEVGSYIGKIAKGEGIKLDAPAMKALFEQSGGDLRHAINLLQAASSTTQNIDERIIYSVAARARPKDIREIMELALSGRFADARGRLLSVMGEQGISGEEVIKQMHSEVFSLEIPEAEKVGLIDRIGEYEFRMVEGASEQIQLAALLAQMSLIGKKAKKQN